MNTLKLFGNFFSLLALTVMWCVKEVELGGCVD